MNFRMEKFRIGVNENGFHFQDSDTGVIFTLISVDDERVRIAICSESADKNVCNSLKNTILDLMNECGFDDNECTFEEIEQDKCYISENKDLFILEDFSDAGICVRHKETNKIIIFNKIENEVPLILFDLLSSSYGYEEAVKDVFNLCSYNIQQIKVWIYYRETTISRYDDIKTIRPQLLKCIVDAVKDMALSKASTEPEYEVLENRIIIKMDEFSKLKMKKSGNSWLVDESQNPFPVRGLVYSIEAVKKFPQLLNNVCYIYKFENKTFEITITPENVRNILKKVIKRRGIDLTV